MIRPVNFLFNAQTAVNNAFQVRGDESSTQQNALQEFDGMVKVLRDNDVDVLVIDDTPQPQTPDSIFPNNWISFHHDGTVVLYPMFAENRRLERKASVLNTIAGRYKVKRIINYSGFEQQNKFLEGTGSMVLDREKRIAYACLSPRTDAELVNKFCSEMNYKPVIFTAVDGHGNQIYHTNVMMCVADRYVVICLETIPDEKERNQVKESICRSGKQLVEISMAQLNHFAGNMLQMKNRREEKLLVMSTQAYESLSTAQREILESFNRLIHAPLNVIEKNGGGSARCMIAEIHLNER